MSGGKESHYKDREGGKEKIIKDKEAEDTGQKKRGEERSH